MITNRSIAVLMLSLGIFASAGCEKKAEGPAERAGKEVDKAVEQMGDKMKEAGKEVNKVLDDLGNKINDATKK